MELFEKLREGGATGGVGVGEDEFGVQALESLDYSADVFARNTSQDTDEMSAWIAFANGTGELVDAVGVVCGIQNDRWLIAKDFKACSKHGGLEMRGGWTEVQKFHSTVSHTEILDEEWSGARRKKRCYIHLVIRAIYRDIFVVRSCQHGGLGSRIGLVGQNQRDALP